MASRYDHDYTQEYVSQYIPMPLDTIMAAGAEKQKQYDTSLKDVSTDLLGGINTNASLKVYGQQGGIEDADPGFNNRKAQLTASINNKRDKIAEDLISGRVAPGSQEMYQLKRETLNAANELRNYENVAKQINTANEAIAKNEAYATNPYYATELLSYNTKWKQDADKGNIRDYAPPGIAKEFDVQAEVKNMTFKDAGGERISIGDYISKVSNIGVKEDRVRGVARDLFNNPMSKVRQYAELNIKNDMQTNPQKYRSNEDINKALYEHQRLWEDMAVKEHAGVIHREDIKSNPLAIINAEQKAQNNAFNWTITGGLADPNSKANDETVTGSIKEIMPGWEMKDGKLKIIAENQPIGIAKINGVVYKEGDKLPEGYKYSTIPTQYGQSSSSFKTKFAEDKYGNKVPFIQNNLTSEDKLKAYSQLKDMGSRLGFDVSKGNRESVEKGVEEYLKLAGTFQMNFSTFDQGTSNALSNVYGTKLDNNGKITDAGQLSYSTLKDLNGNLINVSNLDKAKMIEGAKLIGVAQSLINPNYEPGDIYIQSIDPESGEPKGMIINTNNKSINSALTPSHIATKSINNYIMTGNKSLSKADEKDVQEAISLQLKAAGGDINTQDDDLIKRARNITGGAYDAYGNRYYYYISNVKDDKTGDVKYDMGAIKFDNQGRLNPNPLGIEDANKQIEQSYMKSVVPSFNTENFKKTTKADSYTSDEFFNTNLD